jgi:hypothetical protein
MIKDHIISTRICTKYQQSFKNMTNPGTKSSISGKKNGSRINKFDVW